MKKKVLIYLVIAAVMINGVYRWSEKTTRESYQIQAGDKYKNFKELQENEKSGYDIDYHEKAGSDCLIFSPHGGRIEGGVSEPCPSLLMMIIQLIYSKEKRMRTTPIFILPAQTLTSLWHCRK